MGGIAPSRRRFLPALGSRLSLSGSLAFGTTAPGDTAVLTITGDGSESFAGGWLEFAGDTSAFKISAIDGDDLATPILCEDGAVYFGFAGGGTKTVTLKTRYTDGTAVSMGVEAVNANGDTDDAATATATVEDAFVAAGKTFPSLLAAFTVPSGQAAGTIAPDQTYLEDGSGTTLETMIAKIAALGNWEFEEGTGPAAEGLLANCVTTKTNRGATNYGVLSGALGGVPLSGIVVIQVATAQTAGQGVEIMAPQGVDGAPEPQANRHSKQWHDANIVTEFSGTATEFAHGDTTAWVAYSFRTASASDLDYNCYLSTIGGAHGDIGSDNANGNTYEWLNGFRQFYKQGANTGDTGNGTVKVTAAALFSADIGAVGLATMLASIVP